MSAAQPEALGVYVFDRRGGSLLASPARERLPLEPHQVEGLLALTGHFDDAGSTTSADRDITHMRYDDYGILGLRGERAVVATVSRDAPDDPLVPELRRFLKRCEKRLRRRETA